MFGTIETTMISKSKFAGELAGGSGVRRTAALLRVGVERRARRGNLPQCPTSPDPSSSLETTQVSN